jgi:hypothetical protein
MIVRVSQKKRHPERNPSGCQEIKMVFGDTSIEEPDN